MPIYEYVCLDCSCHFEVFSTSAAAASAEVIKCKKCGGVKVKKTISATGFRLSGGSGSISGCSSASGFK